AFCYYPRFCGKLLQGRLGKLSATQHQAPRRHSRQAKQIHWENTMTTAVIYGIKNCDTVKKARAWLESEGIDYRFVDMREEGITREQVAQWIERLGTEQLIKRRSTTWKQLGAVEQASISSAGAAIDLVVAHPTLI